MRGLLRDYYIKNNQPMAGTSSNLGTLSSATKDPISKLAHEQHHRSGSMMANKSNDLLQDHDHAKTKAELQMFRKK